jgi:FkbM family methyltransferase
MKLFKTIDLIFQKIRVTRAIKKLKVTDAGNDNGIPYVELGNGMRFYGLAPSGKDRKYYDLLPGNMKRRIPFESYKVAMDIVIRYVEGGLKLGGARKEYNYKVKEGDVVAEMGAYMGFYTMYLAEKVGSRGHVIAIEPMPDNLEYLKKNLAYNKIRNVSLVEKGVWNKNMIQTFHQDHHDKQSASLVLKEGNRKQFNIEVNTLDTILKKHEVEKVDFMLIQLNGIEPEALEGLQLVQPANMAIAARYKSGGIHPVPRIKELLYSRGYQVVIKNRNYVYASK